MKDAATPIRRAYQRIEDRRETQHTTTQVERGCHGAWGPGGGLPVYRSNGRLEYGTRRQGAAVEQSLCAVRHTTHAAHNTPRGA
jgi:hypothetical protein